MGEEARFALGRAFRPAGTGCTAHRCSGARRAASRSSLACSFQNSFRATSFRWRSCWPLTASAPARQISSVKQTQSTRRDKELGGHAFFECLPYLQLCMHEVHRWEAESGIAGGLGANSSWYGGSSTHLWASSSCVLLTLRPSEPGASTRSERHSTLLSSSSTWSRST